MSPQIKIILGAGTIGASTDPLAKFNNPSSAQSFLNTFRSQGFTQIDTARIYSPHAPGTCEPILGQTDVASWATIDTKVWSQPGKHTPAELAKSIDESLSALGVSKVNTLYLHFPDYTTPLELILPAITEHHKAGKFNNFGISNFKVSDTKRIFELCEQNWMG